MDKEFLIEFTRDLVRLPSPSGEEQRVAERVAAEMRALGFDLVETDECGTVIGIIEGAQPGPTVLLDAHTDTVGIAPGAPWSRDPFAADIVDDAIVGRGSADMKGALAAMVYGAAAADRAALAGRVVVSASTMEEVLEGVALQAVMERHPADFVVIGEATELNVARGGRGRAEIHLETIGRPGHTSAPHLGRNAVLDMMRVIEAVERLRLPVDPLVGPAILALTDIISDPYPGHSVIPSRCRATYDRRLLPGESAEDVLAAITGLEELGDIRLTARIGKGEYQAYTGQTLEAEKFFPAWVLAEEDPFLRRALAGLHAAGLEPRLSAYRFCTNAAYSAGRAGVPTIGYGPAAETDAHVVDERLRLDDLVAAARGYQSIIEAVCR